MIRHLLQRLIGSVTVLYIRFINAENYAVHLFAITRRSGKLSILRQYAEPDTASLKKECANRPVEIVVSGYGIIAKPVNESALVEKVTSDPEKFTWNFSDETNNPETIFFVRRNQITPLEQWLAENNIPCSDMHYDLSATEPEQAALQEARSFYQDRLRWRAIVYPTSRGNMLCKALVRRLCFPVLGTVLLLLVANTLAYDNLKTRRTEQQAMIYIREKAQGASQVRSEQREKATTEFSRRLPYRHALLLDRVASHVVSGVTLTSMAVQPLTKALEENKEPVFISGTLTLRGITDDAAVVPGLLTGLKSESFVREARLEQLEQNRESGSTGFKIVIRL